VSSARLLMSSAWKILHMLAHHRILKEVALVYTGKENGPFLLSVAYRVDQKLNIIHKLYICDCSRQSETIFTRLFTEFK